MLLNVAGTDLEPSLPSLLHHPMVSLACIYLHAPGNKNSQSLTMAYSFMPLCLYRYCLLSLKPNFLPSPSSHVFQSAKLLLPWATLWFHSQPYQEEVIVPSSMMLFWKWKCWVWLMSSPLNAVWPWTSCLISLCKSLNCIMEIIITIILFLLKLKWGKGFQKVS